MSPHRILLWCIASLHVGCARHTPPASLNVLDQFDQSCLKQGHTVVLLASVSLAEHLDQQDLFTHRPTGILTSPLCDLPLTDDLVATACKASDAELVHQTRQSHGRWSEAVAWAYVGAARGEGHRLEYIAPTASTLKAVTTLANLALDHRAPKSILPGYVVAAKRWLACSHM